MTELSIEAVLTWLDAQQDHETLETIAGRLIERGYAVDPDDVPDETFDLGDTLDDVDVDALEDALSYLRRRNYGETLHLLARALGRDFYALETIPVRA